MLRQAVTLDGIEYMLVYKTSGRASRGWAWVDAIRRNEVDPADVPRLRDAFLADDGVVSGRPAELKRLSDILAVMGASPDRIRKRLGTHLPRNCVDCRTVTVDGYPGPRCRACHEQFVRTGRLRNAGLHDVSGGRMSNA